MFDGNMLEPGTQSSGSSNYVPNSEDNTLRKPHDKASGRRRRQNENDSDIVGKDLRQSSIQVKYFSIKGRKIQDSGGSPSLNATEPQKSKHTFPSEDVRKSTKINISGSLSRKSLKKKKEQKPVEIVAKSDEMRLKQIEKDINREKKRQLHNIKHQKMVRL
jgi:hypothetical protein